MSGSAGAGNGGAGAGGSGGNGGGFSPTNPPAPTEACPEQIPQRGGECSRSVLEPCAYQEWECDDVRYPVTATCSESKWVIDETNIECNPPWIEEEDAGSEDEDAAG